MLSKVTKFVICGVTAMAKGAAWIVTRDLGGVEMAKKKTLQQLEQEIKRTQLEIELAKLKKEKEKTKR